MLKKLNFPFYSFERFVWSIDCSQHYIGASWKEKSLVGDGYAHIISHSEWLAGAAAVSSIRNSGTNTGDDHVPQAQPCALLWPAHYRSCLDRIVLPPCAALAQKGATGKPRDRSSGTSEKNAGNLRRSLN